MENKYIFGPVPSRRLGLSLGVDLVPHKTCSLDCVYCECGDTTNLTLERKEYVPTDEVLKDLDDFLSTSPELDYITFSGSGEPTLHSGIGEIVKHIRKNYPQYKICLLTNGTLLGDESLKTELKGIDLIVPSLDAVDDKTYKKVNRPENSLRISDLINDLIEFRKTAECLFWLEVFIVPGVNDTDESIAGFIEAVKRIAPDKVQLNTLDRPGCVPWISAASKESAGKFADALRPFAEVEIVGKFNYNEKNLSGAEDAENIKRRIRDLISRRPCTLDDIAAALNLSSDSASKYIQEMLQSKSISVEENSRGVFYRYIS